MISKRVFLTGAATAAAVVATRGGWAGTSVASEREPRFPQPPASGFDAVVFNDRYSDARVFAQAFVQRGVPALAIGGDAGTLWHGDLGKRVAAGWRRIAGIGTSMDLFILESLGREAGLRVRFRGQHDGRGSRTLTHSLSGQDAPVASAALAAELDGSDWPRKLAAAMLSGSAGSGETVAVPGASGVQVATRVERSADHPGMLFSWILAHRVIPAGAEQEAS